MPIEELNILWGRCQSFLADNLTSSVYKTWFAPMIPLRYENNVLVLQVKSTFIVEYVEENYIPIFSKALFKVFGKGTRLEYKVLIDSTNGASSTIQSSGTDSARNMENRDASALISEPVRDEASNFDTYLNDQYTFETFVEGDANRLAYVAGTTICQTPGKNAFNPLFIHGGSGVGKTHIANAIGNRIRIMHPTKKVLYVSANTFKIQFMDACKTNNLTNFLNFYLGVDVLIVDDIQFLAGSEKTQDTFFHIFNHLQMMQKQLILTSDRSPLQLKDIQDRLLSRFRWGLVAEMQRPDFKLRRDILLDKMHHDGIEIPDDIVDFIAHNVRENVRDLEGILASLMAYSTLTDRDIDMKLAEEVVSRIVEITPNKLTISDILGAVSEFYNVPQKSIIGSSRTKEIAQARHLAIYLCSLYTECSLTEIGKAIGKRTHSTILHSVTSVREQAETNVVIRNQIKQLEHALQK